MLFEDRIGKCLHEIVREPCVFIGRKRPNVDIEGLRELDQKLRGHGPAVVLDQVEVARGDVELGRHLALAEPVTSAKRAQPSPHSKAGISVTRLL